MFKEVIGGIDKDVYTLLLNLHANITFKWIITYIDHGNSMKYVIYSISKK